MKNMHILAVIFLTLACKGYEPLTQERVNYDGHIVKTDGYYYTFTNRYIGGYGNDGEMVYDCFVLYQNGIYYNVSHGGYNPNLNISDRLKNIDKDVESRIKREAEYINVRPFWGLFNVKGSEIVIERWVTASGGGAYPTQVLKGTIVNDTTIHLHTLIGAHPVNYKAKKIVKEIDNTYHFRQFSPKPDSTNQFIK